MAAGNRTTPRQRSRTRRSPTNGNSGGAPPHDEAFQPPRVTFARSHPSSTHDASRFPPRAMLTSFIRYFVATLFVAAVAGSNLASARLGENEAQSQMRYG